MGKPSPDAVTVIDHLDEMRRRIFRCAAYLVAGMLLGLLAVKPLIEWLKWPARDVLHSFILFKPTEVVSVYLRTAFYAGAVVSSPLILREVWLFVKPAVPDGPKVAWSAWVAAAVALFSVGTAFAYFILAPAALNVLLSWSRELAEPMISLNNYLAFVTAILAFGGLMFELPVVVALLTRVGLVTPRLLRRKWRETLFGLFVVSAVVSPTTDAFNMILFALPLVGLYGASWVVSWFVYRARLQSSTEEAYVQET